MMKFSDRFFKTESVTPEKSLQIAIKGAKKPRGVSFAAEIKPSKNSFILSSPLIAKYVEQTTYQPIKFLLLAPL
jgi:hypothetical protein